MPSVTRNSLQLPIKGGGNIARNRSYLNGLAYTVGWAASSCVSKETSRDLQSGTFSSSCVSKETSRDLQSGTFLQTRRASSYANNSDEASKAKNEQPAVVSSIK